MLADFIIPTFRFQKQFRMSIADRSKWSGDSPPDVALIRCGIRTVFFAMVNPKSSSGRAAILTGKLRYAVFQPKIKSSKSKANFWLRDWANPIDLRIVAGLITEHMHTMGLNDSAMCFF